MKSINYNLKNMGYLKKFAVVLFCMCITGTKIVNSANLNNAMYKNVLALDTIVKAESADTLKKEVKKDTTRIILGKKEIKIIESEQGTDIKLKYKEGSDEELENLSKKKDNNFSFNNDKDKKKKETRFKGHWNGVNFGLNAYVTRDMSMSITEPDDQFMSLNTNPMRSMNFNVNFGQVNVGLIGKSVGLVSGLAFQFNNYFFENNNSIIKDNNGNIIELAYPEHLDKSKLAVTYLTIPLLLEIKLPKMGMDKRIWLSGGVLGSLKLNSHTKVVYHENGDRKKDKNRDDFNISSLRYGFTARAGYDGFYIYGDYFPTALFEKNKGPELYPFAVGIGFSM